MAINLTCRRIITAAPPAIVAAAGIGSASAASAVHPDAALLALQEPFERTLAAWQDALHWRPTRR